ncbi:streptophobe family protein [Streptacidiphilus sp. PAMC 29251]
MSTIKVGARSSGAPLRNAVEGMTAATAAIAAMVAVTVVALSLLGAGSVGSLGSLTAAVLAMSVGSTVAFGSARTDSGLIHISLGGAVDLMPLGVTLVGTVVLALMFFRPLRRRPPLTGAELAARAGGVVAVVPLLFAAVAGLARGTIQIPTSALNGMGGLGGGGGGGSSCKSGTGSLLGGTGGSGGLSGGLGGLLGKGGSGGGLSGLLGGLTDRLFGSGGITGALSSLSFRTGLGSTVLGGLLWVVLVLAVGCLAARRTPFPRAIATSRLRLGWGPSVSAVTGVLLALMAVLLTVVTIAGVALGGNGMTAAGAVLLAVPNLVLVALTLGVGSPWTTTMGQTKSQGNALTSLLGNLQGSCGTSGHTQSLGSTQVGGLPLWTVALLLVGVVLLVCGYVAAARTPRVGGEAGKVGDAVEAGEASDGRAWYHRHLLLALRLGVVTAVLMAAAATLIPASGQVAVDVFNTQLIGMQAGLSGSALQAAVLGLLVGAAAGFTGSLLQGAVRPGRSGPRRPRRPAGSVGGQLAQPIVPPPSALLPAAPLPSSSLSSPTTGTPTIAERQP